ncbi:MucB/RseB C-terminal domain-containing protein [Vibrio sp.]|nr:MucB/RseB C-terminal domain-containing protein [Vibrio sp.]
MRALFATLFLLMSHYATATVVHNEHQQQAQKAEKILLDTFSASHSNSYELSYLLIRQSSIEPLLFRHAMDGDKELSQLIYLSGPKREALQKGDAISYLEPASAPFTVRSKNIVGPLLPFIHQSVQSISATYDFTYVGKSREANVISDVIRVSPKDGLRYSYMLWVSEKDNLPLRVDLLDRNGDVIEQYRTVNYKVGQSVKETLQAQLSINLPEPMLFPDASVEATSWEASWLPKGFKAMNASRYRLKYADRMVESRIYSDGLFQFSVYIAKKDAYSMQNKGVRQGRRMIYSMTSEEHEISIVGDLPPETAQRIAQSIQFMTK